MITPTTRNVTENARWMPCPSIKTEYPGLAYICPLSELIIVKQTDALHDLIGENCTGYTIFNNEGQKVFIAIEKRHCKTFVIKIFNHYGNEVIQVERAYKSCRSRALVWSPPGNFVGVVKEQRSWVNSYLVQNWYGVFVLEIKAKSFISFEYKIRSYEGDVGGVSFKCSNNTAFLNVKRFVLSFAENMNVLDKALLIGACLLIGCLKY